MTTSSESNAACGEAGAEGQKRDYEVGYRRPPVAHRFKPGNNANPKGRKKKTRNRKVVISDILLEPITVKEGGEVKQMSQLEAVLKKTMSFQGARRGSQSRSDDHRHSAARRPSYAGRGRDIRQPP
jgi:Family of unknown function (DUF5681)